MGCLNLFLLFFFWLTVISVLGAIIFLTFGVFKILFCCLIPATCGGWITVVFLIAIIVLVANAFKQ